RTQQHESDGDVASGVPQWNWPKVHAPDDLLGRGAFQSAPHQAVGPRGFCHHGSFGGMLAHDRFLVELRLENVACPFEHFRFECRVYAHRPGRLTAGWDEDRAIRGTQVDERLEALARADDVRGLIAESGAQAGG